MTAAERQRSEARRREHRLTQYRCAALPVVARVASVQDLNGADGEVFLRLAARAEGLAHAMLEAERRTGREGAR